MSGLLDLVVATLLMAAGVWAFLHLTRADRRPPPRPSELRRRQLRREHDETRPITWRR